MSTESSRRCRQCEAAHASLAFSGPTGVNSTAVIPWRECLSAKSQVKGRTCSDAGVRKWDLTLIHGSALCSPNTATLAIATADRVNRSFSVGCDPNYLALTWYRLLAEIFVGPLDKPDRISQRSSHGYLKAFHCGIILPSWTGLKRIQRRGFAML